METTLVDEVSQQLRDIHSESPDTFEAMAQAMVERFAPEPDVPVFAMTHQLVECKNLDESEYHHENINSDTDDLEKANLISSKVKGTTRHRPILDIDFPASLIPSSTEGHSHLYLDKELTEDEMGKLVTTLWEVGIIADGNLNQWHRSKRLFLRLPWVKKGKGAKDDSPKA